MSLKICIHFEYVLKAIIINDHNDDGDDVDDSDSDEDDDNIEV